MLEEKFPKNQSRSDLILHLLVWVLLRVAGWIALAKLVIVHMGFVVVASVGEEMCYQTFEILWRGDGE